MRHVVLVHGFLVGPASMMWLGHQLKNKGFCTHAFGYDSRGDALEHTIDRLYRLVQSLDADEIDWVGHSMGGLVILSLLANSQAHQWQLPPGRVVLLGTPAQGALAAHSLARHPWGQWILGQARHSLTRRFEAVLDNHPTTVIRGTQSLGLGRWFGPIAKPNDGTVAVAETELKGARAIDVDTSHAGLLFSPTVFYHIAKALA